MRKTALAVFAGLVLSVPVARADLAGTNAISRNVTITLDNEELDHQEIISAYVVDQLKQGLASGVQNVQTGAYEVITLPADLTTNGVAFFRNVSTNRLDYIDVGNLTVSGAVTNFTGFMRLYGGDPACVGLHPTNSIYAQGGTEQTGVSITGLFLKWLILER